MFYNKEEMQGQTFRLRVFVCVDFNPSLPRLCSWGKFLWSLVFAWEEIPMGTSAGISSQSKCQLQRTGSLWRTQRESKELNPSLLFPLTPFHTFRIFFRPLEAAFKNNNTCTFKAKIQYLDWPMSCINGIRSKPLLPSKEQNCQPLMWCES